MHILHTMLRVKDLDESLQFYCDLLGMELKSKRDFPAGEFTLAFVGYPGRDSHQIEFTYNYGKHDYVLGDAYGHIAIGVDDIHAATERLRAAGAKVTREPGPMKHGTTVIAFVEDPNGYKIELIQEKR
jgi:lactoylglutathione lyase